MREFASIIYSAFHEPTTRVYRVVQSFVWLLILLSIAMLVAEPLLPENWRATALFAHGERILLGTFTVEYLLRLASYRPLALMVFKSGPFVQLRTHFLGRLRYAISPMMLIDLLAVLAFFPELRGLRVLRLLRLLRTVKLFRYSNPFASIFHAFEENSLLFTFGLTVLLAETVFGGLSIYLVEADANPDIDRIVDGIWWALVTLTTVGYGDVTPTTSLGRVVAGFLMVGGMFTLALFAGFVGSSLVNAMLSIRQEQFRMGDYVNHVVICGYDETSHILLSHVSEEIDTEKTRVVIFDVRERPRSIPTDFLWVQGDPTKQSELDKVRLTHASAVIIVGSRAQTPQNADARSILITFTIRAYLEEHADKVAGRREPLYVVAEILDSENVDHARAAGADEVIESRRVGFSMLAHTVRYHGTADAMSRVLLSGSYNVYIGLIPGPLEEPVSYAELLTRLRLAGKGGLIIGLRPPGGHEVFNPPEDMLVDPGTHLVYLAEKPVLEAP